MDWIIVALLAGMLVWGVYLRFPRDLAALGTADRLRELAGFSFQVVLAALFPALYVVSAEPVVGLLAVGGLVFYVQTADKQFPVFKED